MPSFSTRTTESNKTIPPALLGTLSHAKRLPRHYREQWHFPNGIIANLPTAVVVRMMYSKYHTRVVQPKVSEKSNEHFDNFFVGKYIQRRFYYSVHWRWASCFFTPHDTQKKKPMSPTVASVTNNGIFFRHFLSYCFFFRYFLPKIVHFLRCFFFHVNPNRIIYLLQNCTHVFEGKRRLLR